MNTLKPDGYLSPIQDTRKIGGVFTAQVFGWMTLGLFVTFALSFIVLYLANISDQFYYLFAISLPFVLIIELVVVLVLSWAWRSFSGVMALGLFILYSLLNGLFLGVLMTNYDLGSIVFAIGISIAAFGIMALIGFTTKRDLTGWGAIGFFGLIGLILGTFVNIIISLINPTLGNGIYWILTYVGIGIFLILIAYDSNRIRQLGAQAEMEGGHNVMKYSIQGALMLYLDFINIFIRILAITGRRK